MADDVKMMVRFTIDNPDDDYPSFTDALYLTPAEYDALSEEEIEDMKLERWDNWRAVIDNPPEPQEAPVEQPVSSVDQARQILSDALAQLDALPQDAPPE